LKKLKQRLKRTSEGRGIKSESNAGKTLPELS